MTLPTSRPRRPGFTILEIMLVLALLIIVSAVTWPYFESWFQGHRLTQAVDAVRTHWVKARTLAMEEGRAYRFAWQTSTGRYRVAPDDLENWPELAGTLAAPRLMGGNAPGLVADETLPEGVQFLAGDGQAGGESWCRETIVFRPNGTILILTQEGVERAETEVALMDARGRVNVLQIRGLTGVVKVTDLGVVTK